MALDAGASGRITANSLRNLEPSLQIFRSRHGRGPACLSFIGGLVWDQLLAPELNSISAKMLGHQGLKKDQKGS